MLQLVDMSNTTDEKTNALQQWLPFWPIGLFIASTLFGLGGIFYKLDYISRAVDKNEIQFQSVNTQLATTNNAIIELRGQNVQQTADIARNSSDIIVLRSQIDQMKDVRRWTPK